MKRILKLMVIFLLLLTTLPIQADTSSLMSPQAPAQTLAAETASPEPSQQSTTPEPSAQPSQAPANTDFRGLWVATVVNIDYPSKPTTDSEVLKQEALKILDYAKDTGFTAVFLQVRPTADAFYASKIFPWSKYLTGTQGTAPSGSFDPLAFWITEAHKRGIELHAWINPYRVTKKAAGEPMHNFASLTKNHPATLHPEWVVKHSDGNLYFNPGIPEVRQLIVDGVMEIVNNYAVDGIHFDDYFYPDKNFSDSATYNKYKKAGQSLDDWRRENVNILVDTVNKAIKNTGKNIRFGISPFGIWANKSSNALGSDTKGLEAYYSHYADTRKWVKEGMIDYIAPQLYWDIGYSIADYSKLVAWWKDVVSGTNVDLYIGQAAYKAGNANPSSPWYGTAEIEKQMAFNEKTPEIKGSIFYNYSSLRDQPALSAVIKAIFERRDGAIAKIPVTLSRPSENLKTSYTSFYLNGASDPEKPLYLNGKLVENRSKQGYFGIFVNLSGGANVFTLSQEGSYATTVIYRNTGAASPTKLSKAEIPASSTFPQSQEYRMAGEKITLSCQAPIGSKVTVKINGKTYTMKASTSKSPGDGIYAATYTYTYTVPTFTGTARIVDLGAPVYTMTYKGSTKSQKAPAKVGVIMKGAPYYAEVIEDVIDTYHEPVSGNGAVYELYKGMVDSVTGMTGSYARLSSGQWVFKSKIKTYTLKTAQQPKINKMEYTVGDKWDSLNLTLSSAAAAIASYDGKTIVVTVAAKANTQNPTLPQKALISSVTSTSVDAGTQYTLTVKPNEVIEGYYIEKTANGVALKLKRKVIVPMSDKPLTGITIMLDPGHGGTEPGAIGPLGLKYAEKDINLNFSFKLKAELEALGAKVLMTRTTDTTVSLAARLSASRKARPDMFISVHANSMADNVDISKIHGFSVFYRETLAKPISQAIYDKTISTLGRNKHGVNKKNFYVTRGTWTPSILLETGFVPNPQEFEWLTDEKEQVTLAKTITEAIVNYFTGAK